MEQSHRLNIATRAQSLRQGAVALYWDFENLHGGVAKTHVGEEEYRQVCNKPQEICLDIAAVLEFAEQFGDVIINRAFAHWGKFQRYRTALLDAAVDLVQLFAVGANGKNGADIRLCLDVMDDIARYPHIQSIVIAAGDSDYLPLAQKIRASGRTLYGIGGMYSTNLFWAKRCHGFSYYEQWISARAALQGTLTPLQTATAQPPQSVAEAAPPAKSQVETLSTKTAAAEIARAEAEDAQKALVVQAIRRIAHRDNLFFNDWISKSNLRPMLKTLDSAQDKQCYGFKNFKTFTKQLSDLLEVHSQDPNLVRIKPSYFSAKESADSVLPSCLQDIALEGVPTKRLTTLLDYPLTCVFRQTRFSETPSLSVLGEVFLAWLKRGLQENRLAFNTEEALIQGVAGSVLLHRMIFERFYLEHPELGGLKPEQENSTSVAVWIEKALLTLKQHDNYQESGALWPYILIKKNKKEVSFNAIRLKVQAGFEGIVPNNPDVHLDPENDTCSASVKEKESITQP